jgi:TRAP-type uncharacterized transport system substrate-binding protein
MRVALRRLFRLSNPPVGSMRREPRRRGWSRRFRIMVRHTGLLVTLAILLCGGVGAIAYHIATQPTELTIAVGPPNSEDTRVVQSIAAQLAREQFNIRLQTKLLDGGPPAAAAAIDNGEADLAVVRRDSGMPKNGQAVAILRKNVVVFIVPGAGEAAKPGAAPAAAKTKTAAKSKPAAKAKSAAKDKPAAKGKAAKGKAAAAADDAAEPDDPAKIAKIDQMVGKRLGVIGRSPRNIELLKVILRQYRISPDQLVMLSPDDLKNPNEAGKIGVIQFDPNNVSSAIKDSNVDVIMSVGPVGSPITADAIAAATRGKESPTFIPIDAAEAIAEREPVYQAGEIKAGAFGGSPQQPEESIETVEVHHFIVARRTLGEQPVADFTKHLFAIRQNLAAEMASAAKIEKPDTDKDAAVTVHPGAAAYLDGELKTFFDRYSDLLYWGLMAMSVLGSGFAGLLSYSKADDRVRKLRALEKLLEISKSARTADSVKALDDLQAQIDDIQGDMIREVEASTLDDTAMAAYAMSIERAQLAISDRRSALAGLPPPLLAAVASL